MLPQAKPFRISVTFSDLIPKSRHQLSLLVNPNRENLGDAMDRINAKYGKETLFIGSSSPYEASAPTRISFRRVPDLSEF
jgi:hypothetical protein